ncbi:hypothetical protein B566_EDAN008054 [Ephemera danica]|nr:hypothetical protein B566_EDAN008054 [Ephemera danica]
MCELPCRKTRQSIPTVEMDVSTKDNKKQANGQQEHQVTSGFDSILSDVGELGTFQRRLILLFCLPGISCALHKLAWVFVGAQMDHRCLLPGEVAGNASFWLPEDQARVALPWDEDRQSWSRCERLPSDEENATDITSCIEFVFDTSVFSSSAVAEFGLVCGKAWARAITDSGMMLGDLIGSLIFGSLSDRLGRHPIFFAGLVLQLCAGLVASVAPTFWTYLITRIVIGFSLSAVYVTAYVIGMEIVGSSRRQYAGLALQMSFSLGYMFIALFAFLISDWRHLQLALTLPGLLYLSYWWMANNASYFGLSFNTGSLAGNPYINFVICGMVEFPGYLIVLFTVNRVGRKPVQSTALLVTGLSLLLTIAVPQGKTFSLLNWPMISNTLAMFGKMAITASCGVAYVISAEIFPTCVRNAGLGVASMMASIGGTLAPFLILLHLPFVVLGSMASMAGLLAMLLPETLGRELPETLEDGEAFSKGSCQTPAPVPVTESIKNKSQV